MTLREELTRLRESKFVRSVGLLVGGTAFAHLITVLALPVITRLYSPNDFSTLAVYTSLVSMLAGAACLRFEVAVPIAESDVDAINLLGLAMAVALATSAALAVFVLPYSSSLSELLNQPGFGGYLWLVPLGIAVTGVASALQAWFARVKEFDSIVKARIGQSAAAVGCQLACGWAGLGPIGLLLGQLLNGGASACALLYRLLKRNRELLRSIQLPRMRRMFRTYDRFPKYSALEALANNASASLPVVVIAAVAAGSEAGFVGLALYVFQAPISLLGGAIAQVYFSRAAAEYRANRLGTFTTDVFGGLLKTGIGPLAAAGILGPDAFALLFGEEWRRAGVLGAWMTPWFVLQFLSFPISAALPVTSKQRQTLILMVSGLVLRTAAVSLAAVLGLGFVAEAYALSGAVFYGAYLWLIFHAVGADFKVVRSQVRSTLPIILAWVVAAAAGSLLLRQLVLVG
jgi:O-antigen/teichoic acid export membrane protein